MIINLKMILKKFLSLSNLLKDLNFYIYELIKIVVISKNKDLILAIVQIMTSNLKSFNNSQELPIVDYISNFGKNHLF